MHLKRQKSPKSWPVTRKGTAYLVRPNSYARKGLPILIILRDLLNIAKNRKEVKKAIHSREILLNSRKVTDEKDTAVIFDTITIIPSKKNYKIIPSKKGKIVAEEISQKESEKKIAKVIGKKKLKGGKIQINLSDGMNFISDIKCNVNDSLLVNLKDRKIEKCVPLKEKAKIMVFEGKHIGGYGEIKKIDSSKKMVTLISGEKEINVLIKQIIAVE